MLKIIKCNENYIDMTVKLYDKATLYLEQNINYPKWTHKEYPGRESVENAVREGSQYVCLENGTAVGAFVLNSNPQGDYSRGEWRCSLSEGEYLVIHALASDPEKSGMGIGGYMVRFCIEKASCEGYKAVRLDVVPDNIPAKRLYEKMGFLYAGEKNLGRGIADIPLFALYELNL